MEPDRVAVCLVGHGMPPKDFPRGRLLELMQLENRPSRTRDEEERLHHLQQKLATWPRTPENDPYWRAMTEMAGDLRNRGEYAEVAVAFNEFCAPGVPEALDALAGNGASSIVVIPAMVNRGGVHAEQDIREAVDAAKRRHPDVQITYAWPFEHEDLVDLFRRQVDRFR